MGDKAKNAVSESCATFYEGELEQINIHGDINIFYIYPYTGVTKIKCHFPENLYDKALDGIGRKVCVEGKAKYRVNNIHPFEIEIKDLEVYLPEEELPTFEEIRGLAPHATGDKLSEEFIAELRNEWI